MKDFNSTKAVNVRFSKSSEKNFCLNERQAKIISNGSNKNGFETNLAEG